MKKDNEWSREVLYCPNCGCYVFGYRSEDGIVKMQCRNCRVELITKRCTRRKINIQVYKP